MASFHRRPLPSPPATAFSSEAGQALFRAALAEGNMGCFFPLIEQFRTQDEPAYCGLSSLTMVLNALRIDPKRTWKGPWRWFHESMLDCCEPLSVVKARGITFNKLVCLARCNGATVEAHRAEQASCSEPEGPPSPPSEAESAFRSAVQAVCRGSGGQQLIVSYSRKEFLQTGDGHFSPIGGYHAASDSVLILDVARFKYPPHWVPLRALWRAMGRADAETGKCRGYLVLSRRHPSETAVVLKLVLAPESAPREQHRPSCGACADGTPEAPAAKRPKLSEPVHLTSKAPPVSLAALNASFHEHLAVRLSVEATGRGGGEGGGGGGRERHRAWKWDCQYVPTRALRCELRLRP